MTTKLHNTYAVLFSFENKRMRSSKYVFTLVFVRNVDVLIIFQVVLSFKTYLSYLDEKHTST